METTKIASPDRNEYVNLLRENGVRVWPDEIKDIAARIHAAIPDSSMAEWDEKAEASVSPYTLEQIEAATFLWFDRMVDDLKYDAVALWRRGENTGKFDEALRQTKPTADKFRPAHYDPPHDAPEEAIRAFDYLP